MSDATPDLAPVEDQRATTYHTEFSGGAGELTVSIDPADVQAVALVDDNGTVTPAGSYEAAAVEDQPGLAKVKVRAAVDDGLRSVQILSKIPELPVDIEPPPINQ